MLSIPFSGSKRYSYKQVKEIVQAGNYESVFEPFGGSCVLSVNLLNDGLVKRAVVNDYDRFFDLYEEYLDLKDKVVEECYERGLRKTSHKGKVKFQINKDNSKTNIITETLNKKDQDILQKTITRLIPIKYWKYLTYDHNFIYSSNIKRNVKINDFKYFRDNLTTNKQRKYLDKLQKCKVNNFDWKKFLAYYKTQLSNSNRSILILDPPYVNTEQKQYTGEFTEKDTVELIRTVKELNCDFIFFNHDKEQVEEWLKGLNYEIQLTGNKRSTANRNRKDVMAYVKR